MKDHTHTYDFIDKITLKCKCGSAMVIMVTPRETMLRDLLSRKLLTEQGIAWTEARGGIS